MTVRNNSAQVFCFLAWKCDAFGLPVCFLWGGSCYFCFALWLGRYFLYLYSLGTQVLWLREKRSHLNQNLRSIVLTTPVELSWTRFHFAPKTSLPSVHPGWDTSLPCQVREWPLRTWSPTEQTHQEPSVTFGAKTKSQSTETGINAYGTHQLRKEHSPCISRQSQTITAWLIKFHLTAVSAHDSESSIPC